MKSKLRLLFIFAIADLALTSGAFLASVTSFGRGIDAAGGSYTVPLSGYYSGITATSGKSLMGQLHDLIVTTHQSYTTYDDNGKNGLQKQTDYDPTDSSKIIEWYSGMPMDNAWNPVTGGYNREHVWCQSLSNGLWGEKGGGADMHHLRPVEVTLNSTRNNSPYGLVTNRENYKKYPKDTSANYCTDWCGGYKNNDIFEPIDSKKGDVARVLMYTYVHYSTYENVGGTTDGSGSSTYFGTLPITNVVSTSTADAAWELLLQWHNADPVDILETNRNEAVAHLQGNRNPFIDHPEYADAIWGDKEIDPSGGGSSSQPSSSQSSSKSTQTTSKSTQTTSKSTQTTSKSSSYTPSGTAYVTDATLVDDLSDLKEGDNVILATVSTGSGYAMSTTMSGTYYFAATGVTSSSGVISTFDSSVLWTVKNGNSDGTYAFNCDSGYIKAYLSGSYRNLGFESTVSEDSSFEVTMTSSACVIKSSSGVYLEYYSSKNLFSAYKSSTDFYIYKVETGAEKFSKAFLSNATCTGSATSFSSNKWLDLGDSFSKLATTDQNTLKSATANDSGTVIEKCVSRYDLIVGKYGSKVYEDFMSRTPSSSARYIADIDLDSGSQVLVFMVIGLGAINTVGALMFMKTKKR